MTWIDKIKNAFTITTGDGKKYTLLWRNAKKAIEYNVAEFEFPELEGTLVKRGTPMGRRFPLELYFEGENHLEDSFAFEKSAKNKSPWKMAHPFYGDLVVQPTTLEFDNSEYNVSRISGTVVETIEEDNPRAILEPIDAIKTGALGVSAAFALAVTATPLPAGISAMGSVNARGFNLAVPMITIPSEYESFVNVFSMANSAITLAATGPLLAMQTTIAALTYPALITASVQDRLAALTGTLSNLRANIDDITSVSGKQIFQSLSGAVVSAMCLTAATPQPGDYKNSTNVLGVIDDLVALYNQYFEDLDGLQTANGGGPDSYIPDPTGLIALNNLFNTALSNLLNIALNSKSERSIITESETNIILLTHRFYGLDPNDNNITELMENNKIGLNEILLIKKGRKIVYYI